MIKKSLFLSIVYGLLFLAITGKCFADAEALYNTAKHNEKIVGRYHEANLIYQQLIEQYPGSSYLSEWQLAVARSNILAFIRARDYDKVGVAVNRLITDFSGNVELPETLWRIARKYELSDTFEYDQTDMFDEAESLYRLIVQQYPGTVQARRSTIDIVKVAILRLMRLEESSTIQPAIDDVINEYSDDSHLMRVIYDFARRYEYIGNYEQAKNLYRHVYQQYPSNKWLEPKARMDEQRLGIYEVIESGQNPSKAIAKMKSDFAGRPWVADALIEIGRRLEQRGQYSQTKTYYQQLLQEFPNCESAKILRSDIPRMYILKLISEGNYTGAETAINTFKNDFAGDMFLGSALYSVAGKYEKQGRYDEAKSIHQYLIQNHPSLSYLWSENRSQMAVRRLNALSLMDAGQDAAADNEINLLTTDFSGNAHLADALLRTARACRKKGNELVDAGEADQAGRYFAKAAIVYEKVSNDFASTGFAPQACYYAGDCYRKIGQYQKSADCYEKTANDYGGSRQAKHSLFMTAHNYEKMKKAGLVSKSQADTKIREAYEQLVAEYPDYKLAGRAGKWLSRNPN